MFGVRARWALVGSGVLICGVCIYSVLQPTSQKVQAINANTEREEPNAEADFQKIATEIPYLSVPGVLYDRKRLFLCEAVRQSYKKNIERITDRKYSVDSMKALLSHDDPKIRTLAAIALFDRNDPKLLPHIVELCDDDCETFLRYEQLVVTSGMKHKGYKTEPQTVGQIATEMVFFYMKFSADRYYEIDHPTKPDWSDYWSKYGKRKSCASWFSAKLARVSRGTSPTPADAFEAIRDLRKGIDQLQLEPAERFLTLLRLGGEVGGAYLVSNTDLVEACKEMGPDNLMLFMQFKLVIDDPDLQPRDDSDCIHRQGTEFVNTYSANLWEPGEKDKFWAWKFRQSESAEEVDSDVFDLLPTR